eukprot:10431735-Karenia_brevis.AAC.1
MTAWRRQIAPEEPMVVAVRMMMMMILERIMYVSVLSARSLYSARMCGSALIVDMSCLRNPIQNQNANDARKGT